MVWLSLGVWIVHLIVLQNISLWGTDEGPPFKTMVVTQHTQTPEPKSKPIDAPKPSKKITPAPEPTDSTVLCNTNIIAYFYNTCRIGCSNITCCTNKSS
jgi:hypothetical protein